MKDESIEKVGPWLLPLDGDDVVREVRFAMAALLCSAPVLPESARRARWSALREEAKVASTHG